MANQKTIQYAIHADGFLVARVGREISWPILDFEGMTPENGWTAAYNYERIPLEAARSEWHLLTWTKKIPVGAKNFLRDLFGMKPLPLPRQVSPDSCRF